VPVPVPVLVREIPTTPNVASTSRPPSVTCAYGHGHGHAYGLSTKASPGKARDQRGQTGQALADLRESFRIPCALRERPVMPDREPGNGAGGRRAGPPRVGIRDCRGFDLERLGQQRDQFFAGAHAAGEIAAVARRGDARVIDVQSVFVIPSECGAGQGGERVTGELDRTDRPSDAGWLRPEQRAWLQQRIDGDRPQETKLAHGSVWQVLWNRHVLILSLVLAGSTAVSSGLQLWQPQIIKSFGLTNMQTGLLNSVPFGLASIVMLWWGRRSDLTGERVWHAALPLMLAT